MYQVTITYAGKTLTYVSKTLPLTISHEKVFEIKFEEKPTKKVGSKAANHKAVVSKSK